MSTLQEILMKKYDLEDGDILLDDIYVPIEVAVNHLNTLVGEVNNLQKENKEIETLKRDLKYLLKGTEYFRPDMKDACEEIRKRHSLEREINL